MADGTVAHAFARELSGDYPLFEETREVSLVLAGPTVSQQEQLTNPVWRLQTSDEKWLVTLGRGSLSLESLAYAGRRDFCDRLTRVAKLFIATARPPRFDRFGVRYINRVADSDIVERIPTLVRPQMIGAATLDLPDGTALNHSLLEFQVNHDAHTVLVRCGVLPAGTTIDPAVPATPLKSWILDIDSALTGADAIQADDIEDSSWQLAERAYRFFRYIVTTEFIETFKASR
jgi:uncharacterized protein (TIGR04255 family)